MNEAWGRRWLGFPPGRGFVLLPESPRRCAIEGLALYDAVSVRQQAYVVAGRTLIRTGLARVLTLRRPTQLPDQGWWTSWLDDVVTPQLGGIGGAAFRLLGDGSTEPARFTCLLFDDKIGAPVAFGKGWQTTGKAMSDAVTSLVGHLGSREGDTFGVPELIDMGTHRARSYMLQRPLPAGGHRRMPSDPGRLRGVIAELQQSARGPLGPTPDANLVPVHGSLTPLNLRMDRSGKLWLVDWDKADWGPPFYDEVRYWMSDIARRGYGSGVRRARRVLQRLGPGCTAERLHEALEWRVRVRGSEVLPMEQAIRDGLFQLLGRR